VLFMPWGYGLAATVVVGRALGERADHARGDEVWAVGGDAYVSRPGPGVVDGVGLVGSFLDPEVAGAPRPEDAIRLR
jgi:hypothetical protein